MKTNTALQTELTTLITDPLNGQNTAADVRTIISDLIDSSVPTVNSDTTVEGTDDTTTAYMGFGINVVITATNTDYCARLANPPVKGGTVNIINTSSRTITIFPSQTGGSINGVVDGSFIVPNDGKSYIFTCYENPLPGAWTVASPAWNQIVIPEMSVPHTFGTVSNYAGVGIAYPIASTPVSAGGDGLGNIYVTPANAQAWGHLLSFATSTKTKVYTNAVAADNVYAGYGINVFRCVSYINDVPLPNNIAQECQIEVVRIADNNTQIIVGGTLNSPNEVGDTGTFWNEAVHTNGTPYLGLLQTAGMVNPATSGFYWTYYMTIAPTVATKTYKFQIFVEYF